MDVRRIGRVQFVDPDGVIRDGVEFEKTYNDGSTRRTVTYAGVEDRPGSVELQFSMEEQKERLEKRVEKLRRMVESDKAEQAKMLRLIGIYKE